MEGSIRYAVPDSIEGQYLLDKIGQKFTISSIDSGKTAWQYWDTFDWRVFRSGLVLYCHGQCLQLVERSTNCPIASIELLTKEPLKFCRDLPAGLLRDRLDPIVKLRALLLLASTTIETSQLSIVNKDAKIICRLLLEQHYLIDHHATSGLGFLTLKTVRGYAKEAKKIQKIIFGCGLNLSNDDQATAIFKAIGLTPSTYSSKINLSLTPKQPVSLAAVAIFKSQAEVMRINEAGIKADIDTEFLHDFRVALRRTRAGLSQLKGIFPNDITSRFKKELAAIGKMTNRMRDLDVYLLKKEYYCAMLPGQLRAKLDHLFELLSKERSKERQKVVCLLSSNNYRKTLSEWEKFLDSYELNIGDDSCNSSKPVVELAEKFIFKTWRRAISKGRLIHNDSADQELHLLRLDCKKLRYLLEFFGSLFDTEKIQFLTNQLKKLQDNLGDFNDICVQQETLQEYIEHQLQGKPDAIDVAAAIGGLITHLNHQQQEVRMIFEQTFKEFNRPKNNRLFQEMFNKKKKRFTG